MSSNNHSTGWTKDDQSSSDQLLIVLYDELLVLASRRLSHEHHNLVMEPAALVHEAYLRLAKVGGDEKWDCRGHFFAAAAEAMRRILIDRARNDHRIKRGGNGNQIDFDKIAIGLGNYDAELLVVEEMLENLAIDHPHCADLVNLRCFGGLTLAAAADSLGLAHRTADRHWAFARQWLIQSLAAGDQNPVATNLRNK